MLNPTEPELARTPSAPMLGRHYKWELLGLLFLAYFFHQGDRAIFGVVLSSIKTELKLTDQQLGMVGSILFLTLALMMPLAGYLGDIWSRKWIITGSLFFWSTATMLTGVVRGLPGLMAFRSVATAGGESFYAPAACSLLGSLAQADAGPGLVDPSGLAVRGRHGQRLLGRAGSPTNGAGDRPSTCSAAAESCWGWCSSGA